MEWATYLKIGMEVALSSVVSSQHTLNKNKLTRKSSINKHR